MSQPGSAEGGGVTAADGEPLGPADEVNLLLDRGDSVYVVTVAGLLGRGGFVDADGQIDIDGLRTALAERIEAIPRLRRRVEGTPGHHRFVDTDVDLRAHVRVLDPVADHADFERVCARVSTTRLPRTRPLWELLLVPRAHPGMPVGWVFRVHHALADGVTAVRMLDELFDPHLRGSAAADERPGTIAPAGRVSAPGYGAGLVRAMLRRIPRTVLLGRLGIGRCVRLVSVPLSDLKRCARAVDATVNDAVLAVAGSGARSAYLAAGEAVPADFPVSVPVLLPEGSVAEGTTNQVSAVVVRVPLGDLDFHTRLRAVAARSPTAVAQARSAPLPWFSRTRIGAHAMRLFTAHQRMIGLLSTNVRGPERERTLCGAPIEAAWALPVLGGNVRVAVAASSYAGRMWVSVLWSDSLGEVGEAFVDGMRAVLADLG